MWSMRTVDISLDNGNLDFYHAHIQGASATPLFQWKAERYWKSLPEDGIPINTSFVSGKDWKRLEEPN